MTSVDPRNDAGRSYVFDPDWRQERERLAAIENIWDATSIASFEALGVSEGWRCLEVGAGGGSLAAWLCNRVGPSGRVVATDIDTRFLQAIEAPNLEVVPHDIAHDPLGQGEFDLVHCRLLLEHLPAREAALQRMIDALRPGGVLLIEEFDHVSFLPDPAASAAARNAWSAFLSAFRALAVERRLDLDYGRRLFGMLSVSGLAGVEASGKSVVERGGTAGRGLLRLSVISLREQLIATGKIDAARLDFLLAMLNDSAFTWMSQVMVAAWGYRPLAA